ncbi:MAG: MerR family transcriptional regulator, partial [Oscillospiraceae bacterium]|nr:MerR family transcriptional regulator [Oscillospiraceae bacterium]
VSQVAKTFGISTRMLRYYEQVGLIESIRNDDNSYRHYDQDMLKRLQQIVILRKLQIPIKQIRNILNNQNAVTIIEVFEQNISELDEKITALSTVKSLLARFVDDLQAKADVSLKLDFLNDKTMISLVDSLSVPISRIEEKIPIDGLNKASETLSKEADKSVRIVYRPPSRVAYIQYEGDVTPGDGRHRKISEAKAQKFIEDMNLVKLKPDFRVFAFGNESDQGNIWITIPDDLDVPDEIPTQQYPGGLYAACTENFIVGEWVNKSDNYEWHNSNFMRAIGWEYFNPFNVYDLNDYDDNSDWNCTYTTELYPIREIQKFSVKEMDSINAKLNELDKLFASRKQTNIDLMSLTLQKQNGGIHELNYPGGCVELKVDNAYHSGSMVAKHEYSYPIKIELRVKSDKGTININCAHMGIGLNDRNLNQLVVCDKMHGWEFDSYKKLGTIPPDEYVDIEWILGKNEMIVKVNGEIRFYGTNFGYIKEYEKNPEYSLAGELSFGTAWGSTITVQSLRVTEL